ncbi:hypothetical protein N7G274_010238 [Stereocaulon virgatum]|uniref:Uncharacterized protein n=1 Tax=Stereocaulon virgatum TaxID=373712 RepID=A0ABR4A0V3_9LECA
MPLARKKRYSKRRRMMFEEGVHAQDGERGPTTLSSTQAPTEWMIDAVAKRRREVYGMLDICISVYAEMARELFFLKEFGEMEEDISIRMPIVPTSRQLYRHRETEWLVSGKECYCIA